MQAQILEISKKFPLNGMFSAQDVKAHMSAHIPTWLIEANMRAIAKCFPFDIKLACICDSNQIPSFGYVNGSATEKRYFFIRTR